MIWRNIFWWERISCFSTLCVDYTLKIFREINSLATSYFSKKRWFDEKMLIFRKNGKFSLTKKYFVKSTLFTKTVNFVNAWEKIPIISTLWMCSVNDICMYVLSMFSRNEYFEWFDVIFIRLFYLNLRPETNALQMES